MTAESKAIRFDRVSHAFGDKPVLRDISLTLTEKRIAIVGANGSGKSTFARMINGLLVPDAGTVSIAGLDTARDGKAVRRRVGFVFQNPDNQIVFPIVEEDIAFGMKNIGLKKPEIETKTTEMLRRYGLEGHRTHPAHQLSGGQKQLLAISGVLVMEPDIIVFDEPTTLLDLRNKMRVAEAIRDLSQTAVVVTHDLDLIAGFDRVIVFDEGRVMADDAPSAALKRYVEAMRGV